jgi:hypothetical protein
LLHQSPYLFLKKFTTYNLLIMKKSFLSVVATLLVITLLSQAIPVNKSIPKAPEDPTLTVSLPASKWQQIIAIIHNAPVTGELRDPLIGAINQQANTQLAIMFREAQIKDSITNSHKVDTSKAPKTKKETSKTTTTNIEKANVVNIGGN